MLAKAETLGFEEGEDLKGLRPIDPQRDVATPVPGAARAFEFHDEWSLPVTVTRYELEEVKRTSIDRAVCRMVITPAGETAVQALYRVRTVRPRLAVQLPAKATPDSDPVRINGQPVTLQKGKNDALVVPLVNASADEPFVLEVRYVLPPGSLLALPTVAAGRRGRAEGLSLRVRAGGTGRDRHQRLVVGRFQWVHGQRRPLVPAQPANAPAARGVGLRRQCRGRQRGRDVPR